MGKEIIWNSMMDQLFPRAQKAKFSFLIPHIFIVTFLISILLSIISYANLSPINKDGVLYLQAAEAFLTDGFIASKNIYIWPFYPILIAITSNFFHIPLIITVYLLNTLLIAATCAMFVAVIKRIGASPTTLVLAAITILCYWFLNTSRNDVLRDYGYWFFYLSAIYYVLKFCDKTNWISAIGWNISIIFAALFRPEAIVFLVVPLILLFNKDWNCKERIKFTLKINFLLFLIAVTLAVFLLFSIYQPIYLNLISHIIFIKLTHVIEPIINTFVENKNIIADSILNNLSYRHATESLISIIFTLVFLTFFNVLGVIYFFLAIYGLVKQVFPKNDNAKRILLLFFVINLSMLITFVCMNYFLSKRYAAGTALIVLTIIPYALERLLPHKKTFIAVITIMILAAIPSVVHLKSDKSNIITAGKWIDAHVSSDMNIVTNDRRLAFYAKRKIQTLADEQEILILLKKNQLNAPLIALRFTAKDQALEKEILTYLKTPTKTIANKNEKVLIFINIKKINK